MKTWPGRPAWLQAGEQGGRGAGGAGRPTQGTRSGWRERGRTRVGTAA